MRLSDLRPGDSAVILKVLGHGAFRKRIMEMGFVRGKTVAVLLNAPLKDPVKYQIMGYEVSLRQSEAEMIEIITEQQAQEIAAQSGITQPHIQQDLVQKIINTSGKTINIALVGNPNSGKTSLFNAASGAHEHVGNYGGVTVDSKRGKFSHKGYNFVIYDLPGTYSLSAYTPEEIYVRRHLTDHTVDVVINVVAASNLERNLYLTTELIDMDCTTVMALNMYDELSQQGAELNYDSLGAMFGIPIVPTVSRSGKGIVRLFDTVIDIFENREPKLRHTIIPHVQEVESAISSLSSRIEEAKGVARSFPPRYIATKLLETDREIENAISDKAILATLSEIRNKEVANIEKLLDEDIETIIANDKYGFISGALKETYYPGQKEEINATQIIDTFVTHKLWGFPFFFLFMWLMFQATFSLGQYPMDWIESGVGWLGGVFEQYMSDGMLKSLIIDGIIGGVGGVIVFLPNILILYLFISFMEDSGYMARAAFIMDKVMHKMGLHGKSFIPLIMGFGCNVPAIMSTRTIESRSSRLITILINPFMSCSARLPIYILLVGAFFPENGGTVMLMLYLLGIIIGVITAKVLRKFYFKKDETPFVMELPPYRLPTARTTLIHMWDKAAQYLKKMGGIILIASIVVWFLTYFPHTDKAEISDTISYTSLNDVMSEGDDVGAAQPTEVQDPQLEELINYYQQKNSYIGRIGNAVQPVMAPLGFDWKASVSLLTGMAAKEVIVSTLGVLHSESGADENSATLQHKLREPDIITGKPSMTTASALSFLVFVLLYFPCLAAMVAISKETGSWKWALFSFVYNTAIAWVAAFITYRIALLFF